MKGGGYNMHLKDDSDDSEWDDSQRDNDMFNQQDNLAMNE